MIGIDKDSSLEGEKVSIKHRKFIPMRPKREGPVTFFQFKATIFANTIVHEKLSPSRRPAKTNSLVDIGDELRAETIYGYTDKVFPDPKIVNATGQHKGGFVQTRSYTYTVIVVPLRAAGFYSKTQPVEIS